MSPLTEKQLNHIRKLDADAPSATLSPGPSVSSTHARAAVKRCCAAWQRAFNARMEKPGPRELNEFDAAQDAAKAYRNAMPVLACHEDIHAFIACLCHGMLIGAISQENSGRLAYVAQVALSSAQRGLKPPKTLKSAPAKTPKDTTKKPEADEK